MTNGYCTLGWQASDLIRATRRETHQIRFPACTPKLENKVVSLDSPLLVAIYVLLEDGSSKHLNHPLSIIIALCQHYETPWKFSRPYRHVVRHSTKVSNRSDTVSFAKSDPKWYNWGIAESIRVILHDISKQSNTIEKTLRRKWKFDLGVSNSKVFHFKENIYRSTSKWRDEC